MAELGPPRPSPNMDFVLTKHQLQKHKRHFHGLSNQGTKEAPLEYFPNGQWPLEDHRKSRTHFKQANAETQETAWNPAKRSLSQNPSGFVRESRKGMVPGMPIPRKDKGEFPDGARHFKKHNERSRAYDELPLDRKHRSKPAGQPGDMVEVERQMGRHCRVKDLKQMRNQIGVHKPGDKNYDEVERSDEYWKYGSTVSTQEFSKIAGGGAGQKEMLQGRPRRRLDKERSDRSYCFGMHTQKMANIGRTKAGDADDKRDKGRPFREVMAEQMKIREIQDVCDLPDTVTWGAQEEERLAAEEAAAQAKAEEAAKNDSQTRNKSRNAKSKAK